MSKQNSLSNFYKKRKYKSYVKKTFDKNNKKYINICLLVDLRNDFIQIIKTILNPKMSFFEQ